MTHYFFLKSRRSKAKVLSFELICFYRETQLIIRYKNESEGRAELFKNEGNLKAILTNNFNSIFD